MNRAPLPYYRRWTLIGCLLQVAAVGSGCVREHASERSVEQGISPATAEVELSESSASAGMTLDDQIENVRLGSTTRIAISWRVSDEDLNSVTLPDVLTEFLIDAGELSDESLAAINKLSNLAHLRLRACRISDRGLELLGSGQLDSLRILNLPQAEVSAVGIRHLQTLPKLSQLRLGGTGIDDEAVIEIAKLPSLQSLHLIGPNMTDEGLMELAAAPKLMSFYLDDCELGDSAWQKLFKAKPTLHVHIDQQHHDRDPHGGHESP